MAGRQRDKLPTTAEEEWATADQQRARTPLHGRRERRIQLAFTRHFRDQDLPTNGATCRLYLSQFNLELRLVRVPQHGDDGGFRSELV